MIQPEKVDDIPAEIAEQVRLAYTGTKEAIAGSPESAITNVAVSAISAKTGMQEQTIRSLAIAI